MQGKPFKESFPDFTLFQRNYGIWDKLIDWQETCMNMLQMKIGTVIDRNETEKNKISKMLLIKMILVIGWKKFQKGSLRKTGFRNNKDMFTPSGNRRKWETLHEEVTLDNVVRAMKART